MREHDAGAERIVIDMPRWQLTRDSFGVREKYRSRAYNGRDCASVENRHAEK